MTDLFQSPYSIPEAGPVLLSTPLCSSDAPLVLFPVRLETRFFTLADGATELRVRVFPDKIHLDSHETELTKDEQTWGQHYWEQHWLAGNDAAGIAAAWRQLADRFGARRAAWIVRQLEPLNATERPTAPTPAGQPLPTAPKFPAVTVAATDDSWRHAPQARLLPDRWIAVVHAGGQVALTVTGKDIKRPLAVGPDPRAPELSPEAEKAIKSGERLAVDDGMKWMVDFDEAESVGMALRLKIPQALLTGLQSLVVFGVAQSLTADQTSAQLADLLDAHHYTDSLAFVRPGTPTNNTDDRRADYSSYDPGHEHSLQIEVLNTPALDDNNAQRVGAALGLPTSRIAPTFCRIDRGLERDDAGARSMNTALWQVGWGYFLSNMIGPEAGLKAPDLDWAREHFRGYVRAFGPFPTLRCGAQPYGILPVTSLNQWQPGPDEAVGPQDAALKSVLLSLRDVWRGGIASVARIGNRQQPPDPDADLADVMRTDGISNAYHVRSVLGKHFLQHLRHFLGATMAPSDAGQTHLLETLGIPWRPRLSHVWNADYQWTMELPLIQAGEVSPWSKLEPNYIETLLGTPEIAQLLSQPSADTASLFQVLLRHALLREIANAAAGLLANAGGDLMSLLRDAELVDLVTGAQPTQHWLRQLEQKVTATGGKTIREFLQTQPDYATPGLAALGEFRSSLDYLQRLDSEALSQLMQGTLDLSSHRLDAWITSIATKRLTNMRKARPVGQYVGAYGWVENLKTIAPNRVKPVTTLPAGEPGPLQTAANDTGFIHAPSAMHAATAALLRNSHLGATSTPSTNSAFAIDLSSKRVREAARLLDGVRQGQPLGALLGYRIERLLHETIVDNTHTLDRFIAPLRTLAPLVARASPETSGAIEKIAANNVVDGLVLQRRWNEERATVMATLTAAGMGTGDFNALTRILEKLNDIVDGLSDALTAESAHQLTRGNTSRMASTLASIAQGDAPPPELEVARMPRSGTSITHRLLLLMSGVTNLDTPGWLGADASIRSNSDRLLNFWVYKLLGDGRRVRCTVERLDNQTGAVLETRHFPLSDMSMSALDCLYSVDASNTTAQPGLALSDLEQYTLFYSKHKAGGFAESALLRIQHERPADLATGEITLFDLIEQARAIRRLLGVSRGADPEDLNPPERLGQGAVDLAELEARVVRAENALNAAHKALLSLVTKIATSTAESLRNGLLKIRLFTIGPSVPVSATGEDPALIAALAAQSQAALKISGARLDQGAALRAAPAATDQRARKDQLIARMQAVFGPSYIVLPRFSFDTASATELKSALSASTAAQGGDSLAVNTWFARNARVRDAVARMGSCLQRSEVLGSFARLNLSVAQLPYGTAPERWVGLPPLAGTTLPPSKLSLVLHTILPINTTQVMSGLLVDEWVEIVPNESETTALTFQFDVPNSCAPQCVLLAVPPVPGQDWTTESLRRVLVETLDLAKIRAVDNRSLGAISQSLPGLYFALNTENHAVSTDFAPLTH